MPVEIYCPYENKRHRKRRSGIAQLSLSSLHGEKNFHLNRNHQDNKVYYSGANNGTKMQAIIPSALDGNSGLTMADEYILDDLNNAAVTAVTVSASSASSDFALESSTALTLASSIPIRRRRRKKQMKKKDKNSEDEEKKGGGNTDENDYSKNRNCNTTKSSSFSMFSPQSNSIAISSNSSDLTSMKTTASTVAMNEPATANINDYGIGKKSEAHMFEMKEICSVAFFRATPLDEFRRRCKDCLKYSVLQSSRTTMPSLNSSTSNYSNYSKNDESCKVIQYDRLGITRCLTNDIDWKSLCEHHNECEYKRHHPIANKSAKTALYEIVMAMTNPMVVPRCCHPKCLIDILLNALLVSPSLSISLQRRRRKNHQQDNFSTAIATNATSRWAPSQQLLLETIRRLLLTEMMPPDSSMTDYVRKFVSSRPFFRSKGATTLERGATTTSKTNTTAMTANKANRLLSAIYWLLSSSLSLSSFSLFLERELISSGLLLLQGIDVWNIEIDTESRQKPIFADDNVLRHCCLVCNGNVDDSGKLDKNGLYLCINRNSTLETLSNLHDETLNFENKTTQKLQSNNKILWRRGYGNEQKQVSLKDVFTIKKNKKLNNVGNTKRCRCVKNSISGNMKRRQMDKNGTTTIPDDWSTVRSRAYKKFMSYAVERRQQQYLRELSLNDIIASIGIKSIPIGKNSDEEFLWWLVNNAVVHQESSSRRVSLALVAYSLGGPKNPCYFKYVARLFWQGYLISSRQRNSSSSHWLRVYSEWLSDCAVFDQQAIAWEAIQPILQHVTACLIPKQLDLSITGCASNTRKSQLNRNIPNKVCDRHEDNHYVEPSVMACLGYILHRRSYLFEILRADEEDIPNHDTCSAPPSSIENDFQSHINVISIYCGTSSEPWLSLFLDSTRDLVESTLQRLGILSFSVSDSRKELNTRATTKAMRSTCNTTSDISMHSIATSNWPFSEEFSLRKAIGRIERAVLSLENGSDAVKSLLTCPSMGCQVMNKKTKKRRRTRRPVPSAPMTNYIHDSGILCLIFSFCGPKRLAKIPQVCKAWKVASDTISNTLWENAYKMNFGKYCWPCADEERRHLVATGAIDAIDSNDSYRKVENTRKIDWKNLFVEKNIAERMVRFKRNPRSGYKHRTCNYLGCLQILKTAEQKRKHDQMHRRLLAKQQAVLKKKKVSKKIKDNDDKKE